jgi:hypothetical protein
MIILRQSISFVVVTISPFPYSRLITVFLTIETRQVPLVKQERTVYPSGVHHLFLLCVHNYLSLWSSPPIFVVCT